MLFVRHVPSGPAPFQLDQYPNVSSADKLAMRTSRWVRHWCHYGKDSEILCSRPVRFSKLFKVCYGNSFVGCVKQIFDDTKNLYLVFGFMVITTEVLGLCMRTLV
jgi:hypothetical protein